MEENGNLLLYSSDGPDGDQVIIERRSKGFFACGFNEAYVDKGSDGGYAVRIPKKLISNFSLDEFDKWLMLRFWINFPITINRVASKEEVLDFFSDNK